MKLWAALILGSVLSFLIAFLLGFVVIPWLRKLKFGQTILDIGPAWHKSKQGTPVMGGVMFIVSVLASFAVVLITDRVLGGSILTGGSVVVGDDMKVKIFAGLLMALGFGLIGFADDYIKVAKKRNMGLTIMQKTTAQVLVMLAYLGALFMAGNTYMFIPFVGNVELHFFFWIFGAAVIYATVNAVNFTDGVDGLCASVTTVTAVAFIAAAVLKGFFGVGLVAACLAGGCLGYLIWNWYPGKVMMGDTGSMFLGGMVVALAYMIDCPLIILLYGIIYVIEMLSDVLQIGYFKATHGKRIFKMAPIHHHFEMSGWKERKICAVFILIQIFGGVIGTALLYYGGWK